MEKTIENHELKTPSKLQVGDEAYIYVHADESRRMMPLSVSYLFLPCKITAVRFTPSKVYYDVALDAQLPGEDEESKNIRLHGVDSALLFTVDEYCNRIKNDFGHLEKEKKDKFEKPIHKLNYLLTAFLEDKNRVELIDVETQDILEKEWIQFIESVDVFK